MRSDHPDWELADQLGQAPQHRHGDVSATAFLYSNPDEVWAECSMCGARLVLDDPTLSDRLRERRGSTTG